MDEHLSQPMNVVAFRLFDGVLRTRFWFCDEVRVSQPPWLMLEFPVEGLLTSFVSEISGSIIPFLSVHISICPLVWVSQCSNRTAGCVTTKSIRKCFQDPSPFSLSMSIRTYFATSLR
jgi:hypothetical protein